MVRNNIYIVLIGVISLLMPMQISAQNWTCQVTIHNKIYDPKYNDNAKNDSEAVSKMDTHEIVSFGYFPSYSDASSVYNRVKSEFDESKDFIDAKQLKKILKENRVVGRSSAMGMFPFPAVDGMGVVIITKEFEIGLFQVKLKDNHLTLYYENESGDKLSKTYSQGEVLQYPLEVKRLSGGHTIGKLAEVDLPPIEIDGFINFPIKIKEVQKANSYCRVIVQPYAIDCNLDTVVEYLDPMVYEGEDYHKKQDARMKYNYMKYDPLGKSYKTGRGNRFIFKTVSDTLVIDTLVRWEKINKNHGYRCAYEYTIEDYHHTLLDNSRPGTCLVRSPLKFLSFSSAAMDLELTEDFREVALSNMDSTTQNLGLRFQHGKDILIDDPSYEIVIGELEQEMHYHGKDLVSAKLIGYASPDGSDAVNNSLARRRAERAKRMFHIPNGKTLEIETKIDTWQNTAKLLLDSGYVEESNAILDILDATSSRDAAYAKIRGLPTYKEVIKPILETQCRITFSYQYFREHIMNADEAVSAYYKNKKKRYSNGDYYNMFTAIRDSAELDTLTIYAYRQLSKEDGFEKKPFASYLINRMAVVNINRHVPDTMTLKPLIRERGKMKIPFVDPDADGFGTEITYNRPEVILNQAIAYFQLGDTRHAKFYIDLLTQNGFQGEGLDNLRQFVNFKYLLGRNMNSPQFKEALDYIINSSVENKAILYTELAELNKTDEAWDLVHMMADDNPVKWYLFGILWATRDGDEKNYPLDDSGTDDIDIEGIPYYIAYFWKSMDMDSAFAKHYFTEGNVTEDQRKKVNHAYKNNRIEKYRKLFGLLKKEDDVRKNELLQMQKDMGVDK